MAKKRHLLVYDDGMLLQNHKTLLDAFELYSYNSINEASVASFSQNLLASKADMLLLCSQDLQTLFSLSQEAKSYDKNIAITVVFQELNQGSAEIANRVESAVFVPFTQEMLFQKVCIALGSKATMYELTHTLSTHKKYLDESGIGGYLDAYEDEAKIFLEILFGHVERLQSGELGHEFFCEIAQTLHQIGILFSYHHYTAHVTLIFDEMVAFLRTYGFDRVDVSVLEGFDYLTEILKDIAVYLESFFIKRIFSDVYVFEHSLHDSILFMINRLNSRQSNKSDVEFF